MVTAIFSSSFSTFIVCESFLITASVISFPVSEKGWIILGALLIKPGASKFKMMTKKIILLSLVIAICFHSQGQEKVLTKGLKISSSVKIKKQTYKLDATMSMDGALIIIEGN